MRKPLQGVSNILQFNWHYHALGFGGTAIIVCSSMFLEEVPGIAGLLAAIVFSVTTLTSLFASLYAYDLSGLYELEWLDAIPAASGGRMANIHAGFDETTAALRSRYPDAEWTVMDFYDPTLHTEISIRRARAAYPPSPGDLRVKSSLLPASTSSLDAVFVLLAAHEIRDVLERTAFFRELHRILAPSGRIVLLEHVRDAPNCLAYTIGAFHFISRNAWLTAFKEARLRIARTIRPNLFMTCFVLEKDANAH